MTQSPLVCIVAHVADFGLDFRTFLFKCSTCGGVVHGVIAMDDRAKGATYSGCPCSLDSMNCFVFDSIIQFAYDFDGISDAQDVGEAGDFSRHGVYFPDRPNTRLRYELDFQFCGQVVCELYPQADRKSYDVS